MSSKEIDNSVKTVATDLRNGNPQHAMQEVFREVFAMESRLPQLGHSGVSKQEGEYFSQLTKMNDDLKSQGFPTLTLTQEGEKLAMSSVVKKANGSSYKQTGEIEYTQYTKDHKSEPHHDLTGADFLQIMVPHYDKIDAAAPHSEAMKRFELGSTVTRINAGAGVESYGVKPQDAQPGVATYDRPFNFGATKNDAQRPLNLGELMNQGGEMMHGSYDSFTANGMSLHTQISLPANTEVNRQIVGQLLNGDRIAGQVRVNAAGQKYFHGLTVPDHSAGSDVPVRVMIPLHK